MAVEGVPGPGVVVCGDVLIPVPAEPGVCEAADEPLAGAVEPDAGAPPPPAGVWASVHIADKKNVQSNVVRVFMMNNLSNGMTWFSV